jgi:hypothetical protein
MHSLILADAVVIFSFCAAMLFIVGYTLLAPWWESAIGWARISLDFGIAMALSPSIIHLLFGIRVEGSNFFYWYTVVTVFFVGCISLWNLVLLARIQFRNLAKTKRNKAASQLTASREVIAGGRNGGFQTAEEM